jgi:hypothetical protein
MEPISAQTAFLYEARRRAFSAHVSGVALVQKPIQSFVESTRPFRTGTARNEEASSRIVRDRRAAERDDAED